MKVEIVVRQLHIHLFLPQPSEEIFFVVRAPHMYVKLSTILQLEHSLCLMLLYLVLLPHIVATCIGLLRPKGFNLTLGSPATSVLNILSPVTRTLWWRYLT